MTSAEMIKDRLGNFTISEHARRFGIPKSLEAEFYYQRFLNITHAEVMQILRTQILYKDKLDYKDAELLKACEYAQSKLNEILRLREQTK